MVWIAIILGLFLFYRFVERRHKIVFFKVIAGVLVLGIIVGAGAWAYNSWDTHRKKAWISIEYSDTRAKDFESPLTDTLREKAFKKVLAENPDSFRSLNDEDMRLVRACLNPGYGPTKGIAEQVVAMDQKEIDAFTDSFEEGEQGKEAARAGEELETRRVDRYIAELESFQKMPQPRGTTLLAYETSRRISTLSDKNKERLRQALSEKEKQALDAADRIQREITKATNEVYNAAGLISQISFIVTNNRSIPLNSYSFSVSGFDNGRSTAHSIRGEDYSSSTSFNGDIIIEPKSSKSIQWTGKYQFYDRYEVSGVYGVWKKP